MKTILIFIVGLIFSNEFPIQTTYDSSIINLSELKKMSLYETKYKNILTINIDTDDMQYQEFSVLLSRLYRNGIFNIALYYRGRTLDISSNGIEQALPVQLKESSENKNDVLPCYKEINTEKKRYIVLFWEIKPSKRQVTLSDIERFKKYIISLKIKDIGFSFVVDPKVSISILFAYILSIPDNIVIKGILLSA